MEVFVARQPIFNRLEQVIAYELLFRSGKREAYDAADHDAATVSVISGAFLLLGMNKATGGKRAYINFTRNVLKQELVTHLPPEAVVIEILEDVEPDDEMLAICKKLKQLGYVIALDDFVFAAKFQQLLAVVDIIKVDFLAVVGKDRKKVISQVNNPNIKFLAEKVETREDFEEAVDLGYSYFQGYFFSKPEILSEHDVPSYKSQYLRVLKEVHLPGLNYNRLEAIIKCDVAFSYKLLKYINSAAFGMRKRIHSVRHALVMLGKKQVEKWVSLLILRELGRERPDEVMILSVTRAKFGELLVNKMNKRGLATDVFIMGMFSLLDCFLDRSMEDILQDLPIGVEIKKALLGADNLLGNIHALILAYEQGDWYRFSHFAAKCQIAEEAVPAIYIQSLKWTEEFFDQIQ